jgi:hypothetical protein
MSRSRHRNLLLKRIVEKFSLFMLMLGSLLTQICNFCSRLANEQRTNNVNLYALCETSRRFRWKVFAPYKRAAARDTLK